MWVGVCALWQLCKVCDYYTYFTRWNNWGQRVTYSKSSNQRELELGCKFVPSWLQSCPSHHVMIWQLNQDRTPMSTAFSTVVSRYHYQVIFVKYIWRNPLKTYDRNLRSNLLMYILLESKFIFVHHNWSLTHSFIHSFNQPVLALAQQCLRHPCKFCEFQGFMGYRCCLYLISLLQRKRN